MKRTMIALAAVAGLIALPSVANAFHDSHAASDAAAGAAVGAGAGFLLGGPVGAAVGAGVGGTVGAGAHSHHRDGVIVEERRRAPVRERSCTRDSRGRVVCEQIQR